MYSEKHHTIYVAQSPRRNLNLTVVTWGHRIAIVVHRYRCDRISLTGSDQLETVRFAFVPLATRSTNQAFF